MPFRKIIWAIDPFAEKAPQLKLAAHLKAVTKGQAASIEPVVVLWPDQLRIPREAFADHAKKHQLEAEAILSRWLKSVKLPGLTKPTVLVTNGYSRSESVRTLLDYADSTGASLIVVASQARKGFVRLFLGSFAETLILKSRIPLYIVNPKSKPLSSIKEVLFATDLSDASRGAFSQVLSFAKAASAKLLLYHKVEYLLPDTFIALTKNASYEKFLEDDTKSRSKNLEAWTAVAADYHVKTETILDKRPDFLIESILKRAKKMKAGIIAMQSVMTPTGTALLGSTTRQVVRAADCPVWVVHHFNKGEK